MAISIDFTWFYRVSPEKSAGGEGKPFAIEVFPEVIGVLRQGNNLIFSHNGQLVCRGKDQSCHAAWAWIPLHVTHVMQLTDQTKHTYTWIVELQTFKISFEINIFAQKKSSCLCFPKILFVRKKQHLVASLPFWDLRSWLPIWKKKFSHA